MQGAIDEDKAVVFRANCDKFQTDQPDGSVRYFAATKSMVIWWNVEDFHRRMAEKRARRAECEAEIKI
jgi:hypothetical protein